MNILVVGDAGVGKTSWINRLITGEFNNKKRNQNIYNVYTDKMGLIVMEFFDGYNNIPQCLDLVIIMFDINKQGSYHSVQKWQRTLKDNGLKDIPFLICANKADILKTPHCNAIPVSGKSWYNYEKVLREILFKVRNVSIDKFLLAPAVIPPIVSRL